jgi:hypothetical protein
MKASLVVPQILKWTCTQTNEYNFGKHMFEAQLKFEVKIECDGTYLAMNHFQFMVIQKSNDVLFTLLFG